MQTIHMFNSTVISKLTIRQEEFLPSVQSCATGIKRSLLNSAYRSKAIPLASKFVYFAPEVTGIPFHAFLTLIN